MKKVVTIKDLARLAGMAPSTISKALNDDPSISNGTKEKIKELAMQYGYSPNQIARSLRTSSTMVIGMIVPDSSNLYYATLLKGAQEIFSKAGYSIVIGNTNENAEEEKKQIKAMHDLHVAGILATPVDEKNYSGCSTPLVFVSRCSAEYAHDYYSVITDDYLGGFSAAEHLIKQGKKEIYFLSGPKYISIAYERRRGYMDCHMKYQVDYSDDRIIYDCLTMEDGYRVFDDINKKNPGIKGIFCSSDNVAIGVLARARELGLSIPDEVGIVGYDDIEMLKYLDYPLTTIHQDRARIGAQGAEILQKLIATNNDNGKHGMVSRTILMPRLVVRAT